MIYVLIVCGFTGSGTMACSDVSFFTSKTTCENMAVIQQRKNDDQKESFFYNPLSFACEKRTKK